MCWRILTNTSPTIFPGVPTLYNAINNHPDVKAGKINLRSIKACISGSAPLLRETKETFEAAERREGLRRLWPV